MFALDLILNDFNSTEIESPVANGLATFQGLDCDCVNGDCSTEGYCEG